MQDGNRKRKKVRTLSQKFRAQKDEEEPTKETEKK